MFIVKHIKTMPYLNTPTKQNKHGDYSIVLKKIITEKRLRTIDDIIVFVELNLTYRVFLTVNINH